MAATVLSHQKLLGMLEINAAGTVLYCRLERDGGDHVPAADVVGLNLFGAAAPFTNSAELRQRIGLFISGDTAADSFDFTFQYGDGPVRARVLLARIRERSEQGRTVSVLVHVRQKADHASGEGH